MCCFTPIHGKRTLSQKSLTLEMKPELAEECKWVLDLSALEELEKHNNAKLGPRAECIWELDLAAIESLDGT